MIIHCFLKGRTKDGEGLPRLRAQKVTIIEEHAGVVHRVQVFDIQIGRRVKEKGVCVHYLSLNTRKKTRL